MDWHLHAPGAVSAFPLVLILTLTGSGLGMCLTRMDVTYYDKFFLLKEKFSCLFLSII